MITYLTIYARGKDFNTLSCVGAETIYSEFYLVTLWFSCETVATSKADGAVTIDLARLLCQAMRCKRAAVG